MMIYNRMMSQEAIPVWIFWSIIPLVIWDLVWRGMALWAAARNSQKNWFVALLIINSVGILPIIYLKFFRKKA